jgi:hypothetical protein
LALRIAARLPGFACPPRAFTPGETSLFLVMEPARTVAGRVLLDPGIPPGAVTVSLSEPEPPASGRARALHHGGLRRGLALPGRGRRARPAPRSSRSAGAALRAPHRCPAGEGARALWPDPVPGLRRVGGPAEPVLHLAPGGTRRASSMDRRGTDAGSRANGLARSHRGRGASRARPSTRGGAAAARIHRSSPRGAGRIEVRDRAGQSFLLADPGPALLQAFVRPGP